MTAMMRRPSTTPAILPTNTDFLSSSEEEEPNAASDPDAAAAAEGCETLVLLFIWLNVVLIVEVVNRLGLVELGLSVVRLPDLDVDELSDILCVVVLVVVLLLVETVVAN